MSLVVDTSVLLAALDADDEDHGACFDLLEGAEESLVVPGLVLSELDYFCQKQLNNEVWLSFLEDVLAGAYLIELPTMADLERCREIQEIYADLSVGIVDASILALVERLSETKLATLDRRHFATMRPQKVATLYLLPE